MKRVLISTFLTVGIVLLGSSAFAQEPVRIEFAKGKSSKVVTGNTGANGTTYVVKARSGQKIVLRLSPTASVGIKVEHDGRFGQEVMLREARGGYYEVGLEESGDYTIFVGSNKNRPTAFTLTISIVKMKEI
jgi:hypothetical protein